MQSPGVIAVGVRGRKAHSTPAELEFSRGCTGWPVQGALSALQIRSGNHRLVAAGTETDHASGVSRRMRTSRKSEKAEIRPASLSSSQLSLRGHQRIARLCIERPCNFITVCNCYAGVVRLPVTSETALAAGKTRFFSGPLVGSALFMGGLAAEASDRTTLFEGH
jgi:hypothetical protein